MSQLTTKVKRPYAKPPSGIKPSYHSGILTSTTGIASLDTLFGGGITMGSLILLEQDSNTAYSKIIERCFLSAGVESCHQIFYHSPNKLENSFKLYYKGDEAQKQSENKKQQDIKNKLETKGDMKIAWQYQNDSASDMMMSGHAVSKTSNTGIFIDLGKEMEVKDAEQRVCVKQVFDQSTVLNELQNFYKNETPSGPCNPRMVHKRVAFRTLISGFKSSFWETDSESQDFKFLADLRKNTPINSFTMVTMPSSLVQKRHRRYFDACISVASLSAKLNPTTVEYEQGSIRKMGYHGLIHVTKCNNSMCLNPAKPPSNEMAFKFKKIGGLQIDTIHLPPEESVETERNEKLQQILKSSNKSISDLF